MVAGLETGRARRGGPEGGGGGCAAAVVVVVVVGSHDGRGGRAGV